MDTLFVDIQSKTSDIKILCNDNHTFFNLILTLFEKYCYYLIFFNNSIQNVISNFKSFTIFDFYVKI